MKKLLIATLAAIWILAAFALAQAKDITLRWDPSPSQNVDGYKVYYDAGNNVAPLVGTGGTFNGETVDSGFDVGDTLTATVSDLEDGKVYSFAVTAYNTTGESAYSNIVSENPVPGPPTLRLQAVINLDITVNQ